MKRKFFAVLTLAILLVFGAAQGAWAAEPGQRVVHASNVEELREAINSNTKIILEGKVYDLDDEGLYISWVDNLTIQGTDGTKILAEKYIDDIGSSINGRGPISVIDISYGRNVTLSNLQIGFKSKPIKLSDANYVVSIYEESDVTIENCELFGGETGLYAVKTDDSSDYAPSILVQSSVIKDCVLDIAEISIGRGKTTFKNCIFTNNGYGFENEKNSNFNRWFMYSVSLASSIQAEFSDCKFVDNKNQNFCNNGDFASIDHGSFAIFKNCEFSGNNWQIENEDTTEYAITINDNNDTSEKTEAVCTWVYKLPECSFAVPNGKKFAGWQVGAIEELLQPGVFIGVSNDIVLTAVWEDKSAGVYTITFDTDGGTMAGPSFMQVTKETKVTMPTAEKSGYNFKYWQDVANSTQTYAANNVYSFAADTDLKAVWERRSSGGSGGGGSRPTTKPGTTTETKPSTESNKPGTSSGSKEITAANIATVFGDVQNDAWYSEAIAYVYNNGMMNGTEKGFEPNAATTRAMIVTMLHRLNGTPAAGTANFADVASGQWYSEAIAWAAANGVVNGYSETKFAPNEEITREQLAAILYRYAQFKGQDVSAKGDLSSFADGAKASGWATEAMQWAVGAGLLNGNEQGKLVPTAGATRAEVAMILMRFMQA
jgi:hypothetical protein